MSSRPAARFLLGFFPLLMFIAACGDDDPPSDPAFCEVPAGQGALTVNITPGNVPGNILVEGPNGFSQTVASSQTLNGLESGTYTVTVGRANRPGSLLGSAFSGSADIDMACVAPDDTTVVAVTYVAEPGTNQLWLSNLRTPSDNPRLLGFATLAAGVQQPTTNLTSSVVDQPGGIAYDKNGDLWLADTGNRLIYKFERDELSGTGEISNTIRLGGFSAPFGLAFDSDGALWVTDFGGDSVFRIPPGNLTRSGEAAPNVGVSGPSVSGPRGIAFDINGNLWFTNETSNTLVRFDSGRLTDNITTMADLSLTVLGAVPQPLEGPRGIAIDEAGDMWVGFWTSNVLVRVPIDALGSGSPSLQPQIQLPGPTGAEWESVVFDQDGGLWFFASGTSLGRFTSGQLAQGGQQTPERTVIGNFITAPRGMAANPAPDWSLLH